MKVEMTWGKNFEIKRGAIALKSFMRLQDIRNEFDKATRIFENSKAGKSQWIKQQLIQGKEYPQQWNEYHLEEEKNHEKVEQDAKLKTLAYNEMDEINRALYRHSIRIYQGCKYIHDIVSSHTPITLKAINEVSWGIDKTDSNLGETDFRAVKFVESLKLSEKKQANNKSCIIF